MMSASAYGTGLIGTETLTDMLGTIERVESFGEGNRTLYLGQAGNLYDDSGKQAIGAPTPGYGFNIKLPGTMLAVLDGLLPTGTAYVPNALNQNVFVAGAAAAQQNGTTVMSVTQVVNYFSWVVTQYGANGQLMRRVGVEFADRYLQDGM